MYKLDDWFNQGRVCDYCGCNMDSRDVETLRWFHSECWKRYRKDGKLYPMPAHGGEY